MIAVIAITVYIWRFCASSDDSRVHTYEGGGGMTVAPRGPGVLGGIQVSPPVALKEYSSRPSSAPEGNGRGSGATGTGVVPSASLYV